MTEAIAIDFGTTRTKVAYWDERTGSPRLANLGYGDKPEVPSLFHLSRDSDQISWGYDAEELLEEDPTGIVEVLKRRLQDRYVYANRRKVSPQELLTLMFRRLREQVGQEVLALDGTPPTKACLTLPALYSPAVEKLLREAAQAADFTDVELIPEPVAAAQAWLTEAGETGRSVVVLDCGGGTLDLAYLGYEDGQFRIIPECPPGGDTHVGGHDVDRELLNLLREQLPDADAADELEERQPFYLRQVRVLKERYCRNLPVRPLKVAGQTLELSAEDIQTVLLERFIAQTCESLKAYMARVVALTGGEQPPVLLVGGSARIKGLKEAIEGKGNSETLWWERSEFATVLGAISVPGLESVEVPEVKVREKTKVSAIEEDEVKSKEEHTFAPSKQIGTLGEPRGKFRAFFSSPMKLAFSPDGRLLSSSASNKITLWEMAISQMVRIIDDDGQNMAFSPDSQLLATGIRWSVSLWEVATGQNLRTFKVPLTLDPAVFNSQKEKVKEENYAGRVTSVAFSPDGRLLASGFTQATDPSRNRNDTIKVWELATGQDLLTLRGDTDPAYGVAFSQDGRLLASGNGDKTITLWEVATGLKQHTLTFKENSGWKLSPDWQLLASSNGNIVTLWEVASGRNIRTLRGHNGIVTSVDFSPDGRLLCSGSDDQSIMLWQ